MRADLDHLTLRIERHTDHYTAVVINRINGACLYRAECTDARAGQRVAVDFASAELSRRIGDHEVIWAKE